jgi:hypothetical protein
MTASAITERLRPGSVTTTDATPGRAHAECARGGGVGALLIDDTDERCTIADALLEPERYPVAETCKRRRTAEHDRGLPHPALLVREHVGAPLGPAAADAAVRGCATTTTSNAGRVGVQNMSCITAV